MVGAYALCLGTAKSVRRRLPGASKCGALFSAAHQNLKKPTLLCPLGRTLVCTLAIQTTPKALKITPKALLGTSLGALEHPCEFQHGRCFIENRQMSDFTHI